MNTNWWYYYRTRYDDIDNKTTNLEGFLEAEDYGEASKRINNYYGDYISGLFIYETDMQGPMDIVTQKMYLDMARDEFKKLIKEE